MGQIRIERLKPAPPFYHTTMVLFGPFKIKDTVKMRRGEAFSVILNCLTTKAACLDLAEDVCVNIFLFL